MKRKPPNVENAIEAERIRNLTIEFRRHARDPVSQYSGPRSRFPPGFYRFLAEHNIDASQSVMVSFETYEQGTNPVLGKLLTHDGRFMEFWLDLDESGTHVTVVHDWHDRSPEQNLNPGNAVGVGKGNGYIAGEVQRDLADAG